MLKALRLQLFVILLVVLAITVAFTLCVKKYAYQQFENQSIEKNHIIASQTHNLLQPFLPKLFATAPLTETDNKVVGTDFALLNEINQTLLPVLKVAPVTQIYIKGKDNQTLFSKDFEQNTKRTFYNLSPPANVDKVAQTDLENSKDTFITSSATPLFIDNTSNISGVLHLVTDHSQTKQQLTTKLNFIVRVGQLIAVLIAIAIIFLHAHNLKLYISLKNKIKQLTKKLEDTSSTDQLTKLINRKSFFKAIEAYSLESSQHVFSSFAIFLLDLDNFQSINEAHGHRVGDKLLIQASQRIKNAVPNDATISRLESNTFGVIMGNITDLQTTSDVAKNILSQFETPFIIDDKYIPCSTSVGIVVSEKQEQYSAEDLVRNAEMSMYKAKRNKHGTYEIFTPHMHIQSLERFKKERDIKRGIQAKEIFNRYQPIVDLETGLTHSFEALARWQHPEKGELAPYYFIDVAEEIGLIEDIDRNALEIALADLSEWHKDLPTLRTLKVNVNHSAKDFNQRPTMDIILDQLSKNDISPSCLKIELTESSIIENESLASTIFESLRKKGIHFCMDDFGTGFSSINYLRKLNFDMLKIDRSFVMDMTDDEDSRKIIQTIITMGKNLGLSITAEGVETKEQMDKLKEMGCQYAQGYYFAKPMIKSDVISFLRKQIQQHAQSTSH